MEAIRYLPRSDLAIQHYLERATEAISELTRLQQLDTIESAVSVYNILRYIDDGLSQYLGDPDKPALKRLVVDFIKSRTSIQIAESLGELNYTLNDDFWDFFTSFGIYQTVDDSAFRLFLSTHQPSILPLLRQKTVAETFLTAY